MPKKGHIPERTCIVCRKKMPKKKLIRFYFKNGKVLMDKEQKAGGRGAYFCEECIEKLKNKKVLKKLMYALRIKDPNKIILEV